MNLNRNRNLSKNIQAPENKYNTIAQQLAAQILTVEKTLAIITQQPVAQIEQLVNHVTKYLLEMGTGFAIVAPQKQSKQLSGLLIRINKKSQIRRLVTLL